MMRMAFETRFKIAKDERVLLTQLMSIKKQPTISMRDFVANFNKINSRIPTTNRHIVGNLKTFFISSMPLDINYDLRRSHPMNLADAQKKVVELKDDLIFAKKWKQELQTKGSSSNTTSSNEML